MANLASILTQAVTPPPSQEQVSSGLVYVVAAYAVIWLFIAGYLYTIQRRQAQLKREIDLLREEEEEQKHAAKAKDQAVKSGQDLG
ncbi:MAG: CcmD family protein [Chloroflexi bacterium]|uniref:CcmD family protein n=1 Tax=Candidatus Chlorohelix allophototropha TaxID=3003348 RepID=A0A8T7M926_9CHLR|nr:CcmD family protein [Chloroflexota bacterium]WJW68472.1 CcmD family protein [Chloroflexota bacterium L227-S17]